MASLISRALGLRPHGRCLRIGLVGLFVLFTLAAHRPGNADPGLTVFAASSLTEAMTEIGEAYTRATGVPIRFSFAASSTLARQIEAGAPADLYVSAHPGWMTYLVERSAIDGTTVVRPLTNRLAVVAPVGRRPIPFDLSADDAGAQLLSRLGIGRLAVGDPAHVPAGSYAREALGWLGIWPTVDRRLAPTDNTRAALALVARGEVPLGIVYATDAALVMDQVAILGLFPAVAHTPIAYPIGVVGGTRLRAEALAFLHHLAGSTAAEVFARYGFARP